MPREWLELHDVLRRRAFLRLHDFELDALAFGQRLEPFSLDRGVMHEAVLAAVFGVMKPKPLASLNHFTVPVMRAICVVLPS